ncbi:hypothetical protein B7494_g6177 [Chlorociboria aeruginascens]|nr:hypothetical protein B7494_g6177 [Chlorociboria aeruginascens]
MQVPQLILFYSLASGSCFLLAGSLADVIGSRMIALTGCLVMAISLAVTGCAKTGLQFIIFSAMQGLGAAMFLPTTFSLWTSIAPPSRTRNFGFACFALASPMGLQAGNLLAGVINQSKLTWRFGFYLSGGIIGLFFLLGYKFLPLDPPRTGFTWSHLARAIDIVGVCLSILGLGLLGYVLGFQKVQGLSSLQAAIRYIPNGLIGIVTNFLTGPLLDRLPINFLVTISCLLSTAGPLIMSVINPNWSYWIAGFWALLLLPTAQDVIYTVSNVIITETMPPSQYGLAGGVFNTLSMLGTSIGIAIMAITSESVIQSKSSSGAEESDILMAGYRAVFWANLGLSATMTIVAAVGLRRIWYIGKAAHVDGSQA